MEKIIVKQCINEGERISALIDKITVDEEFATQLFLSENLEATLGKYEFNVSNETLNTIKECIQELNSQGEVTGLNKNEVLVDKLINSLAVNSVLSGNSAAGNWD